MILQYWDNQEFERVIDFPAIVEKIMDVKGNHKLSIQVATLLENGKIIADINSTTDIGIIIN